MNKILLSIGILLPAILTGCGSDSGGGDSDDFYDRYEGLYTSDTGSYMIFEDTSNNILHDIVIVDANSNTVTVPEYVKLNGLDISFNRFYEGTSPNMWVPPADEPSTIKLSGNTAEVSILNGEVLTKFRSEPLQQNYDGLTINGRTFELRANNCTYNGYYEYDDNGYYDLDDDILMTNRCDDGTSNGLSQFNTEMYIFVKDSIAYSLIYDKTFKSVVSILAHNPSAPIVSPIIHN